MMIYYVDDLAPNPTYISLYKTLKNRNQPVIYRTNKIHKIEHTSLNTLPGIHDRVPPDALIDYSVSVWILPAAIRVLEWGLEKGL